MRNAKWTVRGASEDLEIEVYRAGGADSRSREESHERLSLLGYGFCNNDRDTRRVLLAIRAELGALPSPWRRPADFDVGSVQLEAITQELHRAVDMRRLVVRGQKRRRLMMEVDAPPALGWLDEAAEDAEPDVYVLAATVTLIGGTPLVQGGVRVLDPDTGEVVADGLTTDDAGLVRTEVPANKTYRIEIVDRDPERHFIPTLKATHPWLRCSFVDVAGSPVPGLDVTVKDLDGAARDHTTGEDGMLEVPVVPGLYEVTFGDESCWVHSVAHADDSAYEIVVPSVLEDGGVGMDPGDRLTRSWGDEGNHGGDDAGDWT